MNLLDEVNSIMSQKNWSEISTIITPKTFPLDKKGDRIDRKIIAKLVDVFINVEDNLPDDLVILILKCMTNSCSDLGYKHKSIAEHVTRSEQKTFYDFFIKHCHDDDQYPLTYFPYDEFVQQVTHQLLTKFPIEHQEVKISDDKLEIVRLSLRFLCNVMAFSDDTPVINSINELIKYVSILMTLDHIKENIPLMTAACSFINNFLKTFKHDYIQEEQFETIFQELLKADKLEIMPARDALIYLITKPSILNTIYDHLSIENKLYLLEIIHQGLMTSVYDEKEVEHYDDFKLPECSIKFISERFKKQSDLILKTDDSYLKDMEPWEVIILLDILCILASNNDPEYQILRNDKSLLINAIYLLKAVHMTGKENNNFFTPIQKLSELAPSSYKNDEETNKSSRKDYVQHPSFGFKTALMRLIGNLVYKNKINQDMVRDNDGISLLLDCCNIDARNPLIPQWCILAIRNLMEDNSENQTFIRKSQKLKFIDSAIINEMGMTLNQNEEGEILGIVPLPTV